MPSPAVTLLGGRWLTAARRVGAPPLQDRSPPVLCDGCLGAGARLVRAPSCASPACGLDPRTSVWRSADPPCSGAACRSGSPAAAPVPLGFQTTVTSMLLHPAQSASPFECPKTMPSTRQNRSLDRPLHISTPTVDRDLRWFGSIAAGGGRAGT